MLLFVVHTFLENETIKRRKREDKKFTRAFFESRKRHSSMFSRGFCFVRLFSSPPRAVHDEFTFSSEFFKEYFVSVCTPQTHTHILRLAFPIFNLLYFFLHKYNAIIFGNVFFHVNCFNSWKYKRLEGLNHDRFSYFLNPIYLTGFCNFI